MLRFVDTMNQDIMEKIEEAVSNKEDDLRMFIDQLIGEAARDSSEDIMIAVRKETGWELDQDEEAYSEISTEFEEKIRRRLGME